MYTHKEGFMANFIWQVFLLFNTKHDVNLFHGTATKGKKTFNLKDNPYVMLLMTHVLKLCLSENF